jgi:hypothetical protein
MSNYVSQNKFMYILVVAAIGYRFRHWCLYALHLAFISIEILDALLVYLIKQQALTPNDHSSFVTNGITWSTSSMAHKTNPNSRFLYNTWTTYHSDVAVLPSSHISHPLYSEPKIPTHMLAVLHTSPYDAHSLNAKEMVLELETSFGDREPKVCFSFHL